MWWGLEFLQTIIAFLLLHTLFGFVWFEVLCQYVVCIVLLLVLRLIANVHSHFDVECWLVWRRSRPFMSCVCCYEIGSMFACLLLLLLLLRYCVGFSSYYRLIFFFFVAFSRTACVALMSSPRLNGWSVVLLYVFLLVRLCVWVCVCV